MGTTSQTATGVKINIHPLKGVAFKRGKRMRKFKTNWEKRHQVKTPTSTEELKVEKDRLREVIKLKKEQENLIKGSVKKQEKVLKQDKALLSKTTRERLYYEKELKKLPVRFSGRVSSHRKWGKEHPIEALEKNLNSLPTLKGRVSLEVN